MYFTVYEKLLESCTLAQVLGLAARQAELMAAAAEEIPPSSERPTLPLGPETLFVNCGVLRAA